MRITANNDGNHDNYVQALHLMAMVMMIDIIIIIITMISIVFCNDEEYDVDDRTSLLLRPLSGGNSSSHYKTLALINAMLLELHSFTDNRTVYYVKCTTV